MEDINAKIGKEQGVEMVDKFGLGLHNEHRERLVHWCTTITST